MYEVHYWPTPNGRKISILLEELGAPYELKRVNIQKGEQFKPEFLRISPSNKMPAMIDRDPAGGGDPVEIFESGAILEYIAEKEGRFLPKDAHGKYRALQWVYWQMAGLGPMSGQLGHFIRHAPATQDYARERFAKEVNRLHGVMDIRLGQAQYLGGDDYTIADIASWPWILSFLNREKDGLAEFPNLKRWYDEIGARPAVQKAVKIGDDWRQPDHGGGYDEATRKIMFGQSAATLRQAQGGS